MIYRFKLVSDEVSNFAREIEIDSNATFLQLRNIILDSVDYTKEDIDSFFLCDDDWSRQEEIMLEDMGVSDDRDIWIMADTPLYELVEEEGQKLYFVFDYLTDRGFYMEMKEMLPGRSISDPICTLKLGKAPKQHIDMEEFEGKPETTSTGTTLDLEDIYGDDQYDAEDISSGFDIDPNI